MCRRPRSLHQSQAQNDAVGANAGRDLPHKRCRFAALDSSGESFPTAAQNAEGAGPLSPGTAQQLQTKRCGQKWSQEHVPMLLHDCSLHCKLG